MGRIVTGIIFLAVIAGLISLIMSTDYNFMVQPKTCSEPACNNDPTLCPGYMICAPQTDWKFTAIGNVVTAVFIVDYFARLLTVWAVNPREADILPRDWDETHSPDDPLPHYSTGKQLFRFFMGSGTNLLRNLVDLAAIIPFFISNAMPSVHLNTNFVRVLRLVRVFGMMNRQKEVKVMLGLIVKTVERSSYALGVLLILSLVLVVFFGSIIYAIESGRYVVNSEFPNGQFVRETYSPQSGLVEEAASPFDSIGTSMYYVLTTITTVGYGDLFPTTFAGRLTANIIMYVGIVGLALPIGVISSNFADVYNEHFKDIEVKERDTIDLDVPVPVSLKQKPVKQISVQPLGKIIPSGITADEEGKDESFVRVTNESVSAAAEVSHPIGSIPASIAMLQMKFQELSEVKKEWDDVMCEVESIIL